MKVFVLQLMLTLIMGLCNDHAYAQTLPSFEYIKMEQVSDFKAAEPFALQTANYLLGTPYRKDNPDRLKSLQFISKWMNGTPDYAFRVQEVAEKYFKGSIDLLGLYMAGAVKFALENKTGAKDAELLKLNAITHLLAYCEIPENNLRLNKQLKKLADAKAAGKLAEAL